MSEEEAPPPPPLPVASLAEPGRALRRSRSALVLESVLIVASVLLGFALSSWSERREEGRLTAAALASFRSEIQANLAALERVQPKHAAFAERLAAAARRSHADRTAFDVFVELMPEGGIDAPSLGEAAWQAALSTGALRLFDYDVAAALSEAYFVQRATVLPTVSILQDRFLAEANFDPASAPVIVRVHSMVLNELAGQEAYLIDVYRRTLDRLEQTD